MYVTVSPATICLNVSNVVLLIILYLGTIVFPFSLFEFESVNVSSPKFVSIFKLYSFDISFKSSFDVRRIAFPFKLILSFNQSL